MLGDALEGSRAIFTDKTHAIAWDPPISLQSGEPRTLKHCKNTYKMSGNFAFRHPVYLLPASNEPPGPLQDKPVWGKMAVLGSSDELFGIRSQISTQIFILYFMVMTVFGQTPVFAKL